MKRKPSKFNQKLLQFRMFLKLSQLEFAAKLGIKQGSYSDVERGKIRVSSSLFDKLVKLGMNPNWYYNVKGDTDISYLVKPVIQSNANPVEVPLEDLTDFEF